jgi:hypothetical protein
MDQLKLDALLRLRKQMQDQQGSFFNDGKTVNLTSPEEYKQMPPELQHLVADQALGDQKFNFPKYKDDLSQGFEDQTAARNMADDIERQNSSDLTHETMKHIGASRYGMGELQDMPYTEPERFAELKGLLKSRK